MIHVDTHALSFEIGPPERREAPRVRVLGQLCGHIVAIDVPVCLCEVSAAGFSIESSLTLNVGEVHDFRLSLGRDEFETLRGRVVHCTMHIGAGADVWYQTGFVLVETPSPRIAAVLDAFIADALPSGSLNRQ